jgi:hypothetical protein
MGLFGRKRKDLTGGGLTGTAVVKSWESDDFWDRHATRESSTVRLTDVGVGSYTWRLVLEVHLDDGRAPYTVDDRFKVPFKAGQRVEEGESLPVSVDPKDPTNVDINWDGYLATAPKQVASAPSAVHDAFPDASRTMMVNGWVQAVQGGQMSADAFEKAIADAAEAGMLDAEEADAARAQVR